MWTSSGKSRSGRRRTSVKVLRQEDEWLEPREGQSSNRKIREVSGGRRECVATTGHPNDTIFPVL